MTEAAPCEGCGKRPEVYGSSWCSSCHTLIPEYGKDRMLRMRNALLDIQIRSNTRRKMTMREVVDLAKKATSTSDAATEQ